MEKNKKEVKKNKKSARPVHKDSILITKPLTISPLMGPPKINPYSNIPSPPSFFLSISLLHTFSSSCPMRFYRETNSGSNRGLRNHGGGWGRYCKGGPGEAKAWDSVWGRVDGALWRLKFVGGDTWLAQVESISD